MALLRPGRCCSRPQGGCLQHRTEAQRRPKGQDAGGTPALPGVAAPAVPWGVSGGRLLRMPTCTLWETPVCPRAGRPAWRADHSRKNGRSLLKTNHESTRINTNRPEYGWTSFHHKRCRNASAISWPRWKDLMGMKAPRERGRPARTKTGTAWPSPRPGSTGNGAIRSRSAWPMLLPPTGCLPAASH